MAWKNDLITNLETAYKTQFNTPLDFDEVNIKKTISGGTRGAPTISTTIVQPQEFKYGRVTGKLLNEKAFLVGPRTLDKKIGHNLIIPMSINSSQKTLLINLGWTDAQLHELLIDSFYDQTIWFEGITIVPKWNKFTPKNVPEKDLWYRLDIKQIAKTKDLTNVEPFILRAERSSENFGGKLPNNKKLYPNNNHLQYALFWFTMAAALTIIYALRFIKRRKNPS